MHIHYRSDLKQKAQYLRKNPTFAERKLWKSLRNFQKYSFLRQKPIGNFIVDFYCYKLRLIIEIDGSSHDEKKFNYDRKREEEIKNLGFNFLRFTEFEVSTRLQDVIQSIENYIGEHGAGVTPTPTLP